MTNEEFIKKLYPRRKLAMSLVKTETQPDWDEGIDGEWVRCGDITTYITSDGRRYMDFKDAVEHECWWLAQEYKPPEND